MEDQALNAVRALAAGRVAVGASLCLAPNLAAQWVGGAARAPGARVIIRALGPATPRSVSGRSPRYTIPHNRGDG